MILRVDNLQIQYDQQDFLRDVSFNVSTGETVFIHCRVMQLGTILLQALLGMQKTVQGEVWFDGENILASQNPQQLLNLRKYISMVYREFGLISLLNVEQNIALPLGYHYNTSRKEVSYRVHEISEMLGIEELLLRDAESLDPKETRLVNLARALISKSRLLLIDGILEGMPDIKAKVTAAIVHYQKQYGFGLVITGREIEIDFATHRYDLTEQGLIPLNK